MSLYEARLERDLKQIQAAINEVASQVDTALQNARKAVLLLDKELAYQTILADHPINRASRNIDRLCHRFIALHLPSAGHLRYISSVLRLNLGLERVGDYAVTMGREVVQLSKPLEGIVRREVERIADDSIQMYRQAVLAYKEQNVDLARGTMGSSQQLRRAFKVGLRRPGRSRVCWDLLLQGSVCHPDHLAPPQPGGGSGQEHVRGGRFCRYGPDQASQSLSDRVS